MKYEKPIVRDLTGRSAAGGPPIALACLSGRTPTEQCATGETNAGWCNTGGSFSGFQTCDDGGSATQCTFGNLASTMPENCNPGSYPST